MLLATPCRPFRLCDGFITGEMWCNGFEGDAAVAGDGPRRWQEFLGIEGFAG